MKHIRFWERLSSFALNEWARKHPSDSIIVVATNGRVFGRKTTGNRYKLHRLAQRMLDQIKSDPL